MKKKKNMFHLGLIDFLVYKLNNLFYFFFLNGIIKYKIYILLLHLMKYHQLLHQKPHSIPLIKQNNLYINTTVKVPIKIPAESINGFSIIL